MKTYVFALLLLPFGPLALAADASVTLHSDCPDEQSKLNAVPPAAGPTPARSGTAESRSKKNPAYAQSDPARAGDVSAGRSTPETHVSATPPQPKENRAKYPSRPAHLFM